LRQRIGFVAHCMSIDVVSLDCIVDRAELGLVCLHSLFHSAEHSNNGGDDYNIIAVADDGDVSTLRIVALGKRMVSKTTIF
jgi:hypothetical protein